LPLCKVSRFASPQKRKFAATR